MTQENFDKPKVEDKGIPGSRVVAWLVASMIGFPLVCWAIWYYARRLGEAEGTLFEYRAARDPIAWLFIVLILAACGVLSWWMGRTSKR